jgi:hypothetical protein
LAADASSAGDGRGDAADDDPHSANSANCAKGEPADDWELPLPFQEFDLPPFPTEALPSWLRAFVEAEAVATQTPPELAGMLGLACCAVALARRVEVQVRCGWREPVNLFTLVVQPPGTRKTQVLRDVTAPVEEYERREVERMRPEIAEAASRVEVSRRRLEHLRERAAKVTESAQRAALEREAGEQARELAALQVPVLPRLLADDASPERLASLLCEQGGRMGVLSAEGGVFELMAGRYSAAGMANLEVYLKGHAGDALRVDRVNRPAEFVQQPALTLGLAVQPDVLRSLANRPGFRGRGLLGRFLYALPPDLLGRRRIDAPPVPDAVREMHQRHMTALLQIPTATDHLARPIAHLLVLAPAAVRLLDAFAEWIEPQLGQWGTLGTMTDWGGKLVGAVARIAGVLHSAEHAAAEPWATAITAECMERAIALGHWAIPHARAAFAEMGADPEVEDARHILAWIERHGAPEFTKRDCFEGVKSRFRQVAAMEPALRLLVEHHYLREQPTEGSRERGRPPAALFAVNPRAHNSHKSHKPAWRVASPPEAAETPESPPSPVSPPAVAASAPVLQIVETEEECEVVLCLG